MKPNILVVMLDFLVCSLLFFVVGKGGGMQVRETAAAKRTVHEEFAPAAIQQMEEQWNRDYQQQTLLAQLSTQTAESDRLRENIQSLTANLNQTTTALTAKEREAAELMAVTTKREQELQQLAEQKTKVEQEKAKVEQDKTQIAQKLTTTETELTKLSTEHGKLQEEKQTLQQQTQQLGQTVANQQTTIQTLAQEVRASQVKMESQMTDFAANQQQMGATLGKLDEFARTLPATMQQNITGVRADQQALQDNIAGVLEGLHALQADLNPEERQAMSKAIGDVAKGQQELQSRVEGLLGGGDGAQIVASLNNIQSGQEALRAQATGLGKQLEAMQARKPGPYKAVKASRLEMQVNIIARDPDEPTYSRFKATAYPPLVKVDNRALIVASSQNLGLYWWGLNWSIRTEVQELKHTVVRNEQPVWTAPLTGTANVLRADSHIAVVELTSTTPGLAAMELAGPDAAIQQDQRKFFVFKSTAAGLSFEVDTAPDLSDNRYLIIKRPLRGVASWFENPAYRADTGDYLTTADGKLVGIMISREKCFLVTRENLLDYVAGVPLDDKRQFQKAAKLLPRK
jgi:hypothetical protein